MIAYYLPSGESVEVAGGKPAGPIAAEFNATVVKEAIREAHSLVPGYTYKGFVAKVAGADCAPPATWSHFSGDASSTSGALLKRM